MKEESEIVLERRLNNAVEALGALSFKFSSPARAGVPDRIIVWPGGMVHFIELKTLSGRTTALQRWTIKRMRKVGARVYIISGAEQLNEYINVDRARECQK